MNTSKLILITILSIVNIQLVHAMSFNNYVALKYPSGIPADKCLTIDAGYTVTILGGPIHLNGLQIDGSLIFVDSGNDITLYTNWIEISETGRLVIGDETDPFDQGQARIVLTDTSVQCACGEKDKRSFIVDGGELILHGEDRGTVWTRLLSSTSQNAALKNSKFKIGGALVMSKVCTD